LSSSDRLFDLLREVKLLAQEYYDLTKRPLGVTGEVAEYEATRLLNLELSPARQPGFDAIRKTSRKKQRLQIKGRCILPSSKRGQKVGKIDLEKPWDVVLLVLLDERYEPKQIYEADRPAITAALTAPGSKARNERGQLSVSKFKSIGRKIWHD
jgi:uncharacterized protein DUF6998